MGDAYAAGSIERLEEACAQYALLALGVEPPMLSVCGSASNGPEPENDSGRWEVLLSTAEAAGFREVKIGPGVYTGGDVCGWSRFTLAARDYELAAAEAELNPEIDRIAYRACCVTS